MRILILTLLFLSVCSACSKDKVETGIEGYVEYGESDCFPDDGGIEVEFGTYSGELFFLVKEELDSLQIESFEDIVKLKENSIIVQISEGDLFAEIPVGNYIVWAENIYEISERYAVTINSGEIVKKDFKFLRCLHD